MSQLPSVPLEMSVPGCCRKATLATCQDLNLNAIGTDRWFLRKQIWDDSLQDKLPCGIIALDRVQLNPDDGTNEEDEVRYGVLVALIAASNRDLSDTTIGIQDQWSDRVLRAFQNKSYTDLPGPPLPHAGDDCLRITVEQGDPYVDQAFRKQLDAHYWVIWFRVRYNRNE